jgi:hypothetical protein
MLVLRNAQLKALEAAAWREFEDRLMTHLQRFFPAPCAALGPAGLRRLCQEGIARARAHGFRSERDLCKFLSLTLVFGRDFDREQPWATEIVALGGAPSARMDRLFAAGLARAEEGRGILEP